MDRKEIIDRIEEITRKPGFVYILAILVAKDIRIAVSELADMSWRDRLSFQELGFLIGLAAKQQLVEVLPSEEDAQDIIKELYELFESLHNHHIHVFAEKLRDLGESGLSEKSEEEKEQVFREIMGAGDMVTEPIFYGDSGAYDFQFREFVVKKYAYDAEWIEKNKKFTIERGAEIVGFLKQMGEEKFRAYQPATTFQEICEQALNGFSFTLSEIAYTDIEVLTHFLGAFSFIPGTVNQNFSEVGQYNVALSNPILQLGEGRYFLPIHFHLAQSLYESPFYWMGQDKAYEQKLFQNRGKATEDIAFDLLQPIFGSNTYRDIRIKRSKGSTTTDIDVLAVAGNKALVIQAKSKRLTQLARQGDTEQLKKDFSGAVQKAYEQGVACRNAILSKDSKFFDSDGVKIELEEAIDDVYIICLTSDHYPALTSQVRTYLTKSQGDPFPIAISIFDLDIITFYLSDPFELLYYFRQRVSLSEYFVAASEMDFLGFHLNQRLYRRKDSDWFAIDQSFAQLIDANFPALRGHHPKTKATERLRNKWKNDNFDKLIAAIKETEHPGITDVLFYLYDLSSQSADTLIKAINQTQNKTRADKKVHDFSLHVNDGESGISFISQYSRSVDLGPRLLQLCTVKKYKSKAKEWLALGSVIESGHIVDLLIYNNQPWEYDEELELIAGQALKKGTVLTGQWKQVPRNEQCPCGSGKKFKRCHGLTI